MSTSGWNLQQGNIPFLPLGEREVIRIVNLALSPAKMHTTKEKLRKTTMTKDILTECNVNRYLYPSRYNDEKEMLIA